MEQEKNLIDLKNIPLTLPVTALTLDYAVEQSRQLQLDIERREKILSGRYPLYRRWREANSGCPSLSDSELLAAAENSGAFKSFEWFAMYLAMARRSVWDEIAAMLCQEQNGEHYFAKEVSPNGDEESQVCIYCGYRL